MNTPVHSSSHLPAAYTGRQPAQLADVLERVLDQGIVIAGDIELLTIRLRLLVASADKAREMGIDWWDGDPFLRRGGDKSLEGRLKRLEKAAGISGDGDRKETERGS